MARNRALGLIKDNNVRQLLRSVPGRHTPSSAHQKSTPAVDDPPLSSDEEQQASNDDSDDVSHAADIKPTVFESTSRTSSRLSSIKSENQTKGYPLRKPGNNQRNSQESNPSSSAGSKRSFEEVDGRSAAHLKDEMGFLKRSTTSKSKIRVPGRGSSQQLRKYGSQSQNSSQNSTIKSSNPSRKDKNSSPERESFKTIAPCTSPPKIDEGRDFKAVSSFFSSPEKPKKSRTFQRQLTLERANSPQRDNPGFKLPPDVTSEGRDLNLGLRHPDLKNTEDLADGRSTRQRIRGMRKCSESLEEPLNQLAQAPADKLPNLLTGLADLDESTLQLLITPRPRSMKKDSWSDISINSETEDGTPIKQAVCPMCNEAVDKAMLDEFMKKGRMNVKRQGIFCRMHKTDSAKEVWKLKCYPEIKWDTLHRHFDQHQSFLSDILEGKQPSYYRSVLEDNVKAGKNRTLFKSHDSFTPGYYGPRGLRAMSEHIMSKFSSTLRRRAVDDRLVSARGHTGYVTAVMVPELAVRLIMDDMYVDEEEARDILSESSAIGELLNEDIGDVVSKDQEARDMNDGLWD